MTTKEHGNDCWIPSVFADEACYDYERILAAITDNLDSPKKGRIPDSGDKVAAAIIFLTGTLDMHEWAREVGIVRKHSQKNDPGI